MVKDGMVSKVEATGCLLGLRVVEWFLSDGMDVIVVEVRRLRWDGACWCEVA